MNIGIMTMERYERKPIDSVGSSRIRARWLTNYWPEAELCVLGKKYDVMIYQKAYWPEHAKEFKGFKIFDMCDPDWLHWGYRTKEMIEQVDVVTTATEQLKIHVERFSGGKPVICVPDRVDLNFYKQKKEHTGDATKVVWFGYSTGFNMVDSAINSLKKHSLDLIVVSNKNYVSPKNIEIKCENYKWNLETINDVILKGDIVINPQSEVGKWKFKSNNKTIAAWALGMPVAYTDKELKQFISEESRKIEADKRLIEVKENFNIIKSVEQYKEIIEKYAK